MNEETEDIIDCFDVLLKKLVNQFEEDQVKTIFLSLWSDYRIFIYGFDLSKIQWDLIYLHFKEIK